MSATPTKTDLESIHEIAGPALASVRRSATQSSGFGHEALQALLAFSALHQQIRQRKLQQRHNGTQAGPEDVWQLEQFVLDEVLQLVAERALSITGADGVAIALAEGDAIVCRASAGRVAPDAGMRLDPGSGFSGECLVSGHIIRCDDSEADVRVNALACRGLGARSMVAVPLSAQQTVIGLVEAFSAEPYGFNDSDVRSLDLLAELILSALKPEEEDRLAEISHRVVSQKKLPDVEPAIPLIPAAPYGQPENTAAATAEVPAIEIADSDRHADASLEYEAVEHSRPGLVVVVAVVVIALLLGAGLWWNIRRSSSAAGTNQRSVTPVAPTPAPSAVNASAPAHPPESAKLPENEASLQPPTPTLSGVLPEVTGIRHWSSADSTTVVIDLQDQVQYEAHRLTNPERIYFDLHDTRLAAELSAKTIDVGDALLQRVRVAQPMPGVTRVVLETKGSPNFSVSLEPNPYRLVVEVRRIGAGPQARTKVDLFAPAEPATAAPSAASAPAHALLPKLRIVVDAGHGGWDLGTVGRKGLLEKDLVLDIVERLGRLVQGRLGDEVVYTRQDDSYVALERRAEIANLAQADLFISVHANYSDYPSARGVETYYTNTYSSIRARTRESDDTPVLQNINWTHVDIREKVLESHRLAASVQRSLYSMLAAKNPGLPNRGVKEAQYVVLTGTSMPAILAEISFVSSPTDENNLQSSGYRQQIANALYQGIAGYVEQSQHVRMARSSGKLTGR